MTLSPLDYRAAEAHLDRSAADFGRYMLGLLAASPYARRNVARMVNAAIYAVPHDHGRNDYAAAWQRLRAQSDRVVAAWDSVCPPV